jgi:hypothetical protein
MANPNIVSVTSILGNTTFLTPSDTAANVLLSNAASSGDVLKINQIVAANVNGTSAVDTTVAITNDAATGGRYSFPCRLYGLGPCGCVYYRNVDKTTAIYLMEDQSIVVTSGSSSDISYTISYEAISSS